MIRSFFLLAFPLIFTQSVVAQTFVVDENCIKAYQEIIALRFEKGDSLVSLLKKQQPENTMLLVLENYSDFLKLFISEDKQQFELRKGQKDIRLRSIEKILTPEPYLLWSQAAIHLQWAFVRLKFGENYTAALEIRRAYLLLSENEKLYPNFLPNQLYLGLAHALIGTVPDDYQWLVRLASMSGSVEQGVSEMENVLQKCEQLSDYQYLYNEALFFLGFTSMNLIPNTDRWKIWLNSLQSVDQTNALMVFLKANAAMRLGHNDQAFEVLTNRPMGKDNFSFPYLDYLTAETLLRKLDLKARNYYHRFLLQYKGMNYRQDALRKLAWICLLEGDDHGYDDWMKLVPGQTDGKVEADQQAVREAENNQKPDINLLKSRLLFDGGYYSEALECMMNSPLLQQSDVLEIRLEMHYRKGRILHELKRFPEALSQYDTTLLLGAASSLYYAANAALKAGEICELTDQKILAKTYYERCLSLNPEEYKSGIHLKAKAGLNRLRSK